MAVNIRFVPKGQTSQLSLDSLSAGAVDATAPTVAPTKARSHVLQRRLAEGGIKSEVSALNRVLTKMSEADFRSMFASAALETRQMSKPQGSKVAGTPSYQYTSTELVVPDSLRDMVDFAYVPRPVEYHAPQPIAPHENIYHLTLADVALLLNAPRCHQSGWTGKGVRVAMADSGFYLHPYFVRSGHTLLPTESPDSGNPEDDPSGHGTGECANIFAVAPQCTVFGVKQGASAAATLETCIAQNPHVMTNSWGWDIDRVTRDQLRTNDPQMWAELVDLESIIANAASSGICVVFSAGNGHLAFPGSLRTVISAGGATINEDGSMEASSYASGFRSKLYPGRNSPDVCGLVGRSETAPMSGHIMLPVPENCELDGDNFPSGRRGLGWGIFSGTSAAAPQVAGVIALLKQIKPQLKVDQIRSVLQARAEDVVRGTTATGQRARAGRDVATGAGLVDALKSCGFLSGA